MELDAFHEKYGVPMFPNLPDMCNSRYFAPDWARVGEAYPGIIIAPYIWSRRLDGPMWYYGWDCASGCVWDPSVVRSITYMGKGDTQWHSEDTERQLSNASS